jgi:hypothetical protein
MKSEGRTPIKVYYRNLGLYRVLGALRVLFIGHSAKKPLPSAALGKVLLSVTTPFAETKTLGRGIHSAKISLLCQPLGEGRLSLRFYV